MFENGNGFLIVKLMSRCRGKESELWPICRPGFSRRNTRAKQLLYVPRINAITLHTSSQWMISLSSEPYTYQFGPLELGTLLSHQTGPIKAKCSAF